MSVEMRAYDNEHGDPVVVLVATGTYDVSRFVGLHAGGRCEDQDLARRVRESVRRHRGGRAALKLLRDHGGPDFTEPEGLTPQTRIRWVPNQPIPDGWRQGNSCFVGEYLEVFVYDPAVPYSERKQDGSTDRWIRFHKETDRRYVSEWELIDDAPHATDSPASVSPEQTPSPEPSSAQRGDQCPVGETP